MSRSARTCHIDTKSCFDVSHINSSSPPIDHFFETERELIRLCTPQQIKDTPIIGGLTLLGSFSAVESFLREMIRKIISVDEFSQKVCEGQPLTYGAARIHDIQMMPEAILENYSFVSVTSIKKALTEMIGVKKGNYTKTIRHLFREFSKVCQMRHCVVHRGGRLGTQNAITLGLETHKNRIEKPLKLTYANIQEILQSNNNLVIGLNNFLFGFILERYQKAPKGWKWDLRIDKARFKNFVELFYSKIWPPAPPQTLKEIYDQYRKDYKQHGKN